VTSGSILSSDQNGVTLSQDADGSIVIHGGGTVAFQNIERIEWS
jgi:hypothetical protein